MNTDTLLTPLLNRLRADRDFLLGWQANLAMATFDALSTEAERPADKDDRRWEVSQDAARRFLSQLFANEENPPKPITNAEVRSGVAQAEVSKDKMPPGSARSMNHFLDLKEGFELGDMDMMRDCIHEMREALRSRGAWTEGYVEY